MTYYATIPSAAPQGFFSKACSNFIETRKRRRAERDSVRALMKLNPAMLKDLAIDRSEIQSVILDMSGDRRRTFSK